MEQITCPVKDYHGTCSKQFLFYKEAFQETCLIFFFFGSFSPKLLLLRSITLDLDGCRVLPCDPECLNDIWLVCGAVVVFVIVDWVLLC